MDRHTETLLPEICQKGKVWFYHFAIVKHDKTVALLILNMIKPYLSFYIFQVAMSQCVDVP